MNFKRYGNSHSPTILIVQNSFRKLELDSSILSLFNIVHLSQSENTAVLSWIQQNQPDLIVLELDCLEKPYESLITSIRLDWLTRDIPIIVTGNKFVLQSMNNLDYDACITTPYLAKKLYRVICSLIDSPFCQISVS